MNIRIAVLFFTVSISILVFLQPMASPVFGQPVKEHEIQLLREYSDKDFGCFIDDNIVTKELFDKKIGSDQDCLKVGKFLKVDFEKETLLAFHEAGDCFLRVRKNVFRNDQTRKIIVRVKNYYGGCRAGGSVQGWLVIDKIPPGYTVDFTRQLMGKDGRKDGPEDLTKSVSPPPAKLESLKIEQIDLEGCIQLIRPNQRIIKSRDEFLAAVRRDASRPACLKTPEKIDFTKNSLLGINLNTGYCRFPLGLKFQATNDSQNQQYLINISYWDPEGSVCRAMSSYDLWLLVPKLPGGYEPKFNIQAENTPTGK